MTLIKHVEESEEANAECGQYLELSSLQFHCDRFLSKSCASNKVKVTYQILGIENGMEGEIIFKSHPGTSKKAVLRVHHFPI